MLNIIVTGASGRMGKSIVKVVQERDDVKLVGAVERSSHPEIRKDIGELVGIGKVGIKLVGNIEKVAGQADCIIDFTSPEATIHHLDVAKKHSMPIVVGTTGFSHQQRLRLKELGEGMQIVVAPNMSVGVNLLLKVVADIAGVLGKDYDVEIVEAHHRYKKDAPSGTAVRFAEVIADALKLDLDAVATYGRQGIIGERKVDEIGIQSIRAGDIVGDHTVIFGGEGERLEITHRAHSRDTFVKGAIRAALWLVNQPNGLYDMQDVLEL